MELQLGLALPINPNNNKDLDLNSYAYDANGHLVRFTLNYNSSTVFNNKRGFSQVFDQTAEQQLPTLLLLPLTPDQQNHDHDLDDRHSNCSTITKNDAEAVVAGWPPINSWRKKFRHDSHGLHSTAENDEKVEINSYGGSFEVRRSNALYVKVKMEGVGIARKVDLSLHHSFKTLKETLMNMFGKWICIETGHQHSNCYKLVYQDREGDWLLAEDVSWRSFIRCAQRLKLLKSTGRLSRIESSHQLCRLTT